MTTNQPQTFIEIYELELADTPAGVSRREDVSGLSPERIDSYAEHFASRIDRDLYGVRLARVTIETLRTY